MPVVALVYTAVVIIELIIVWVKSTDFFYYFHDRFDPANVGNPGYLGPQNWRRILRGATIAALPVVAALWLIYYINEFYAALSGFVFLALYNLLLRGSSPRR
ncbi:hypothetical protein [Thermococcus stetteri]|uniref:hypothetical protein n=1 Tax=Thermococcus stetteri TaxID=49900 RepID=UPI001AEB04F8|nr:hypothetical protein [Thermococcus stetteri]MBP1911771.1 hypothetical protein [Thermococcus stetteri]